jgi:hypothetical protein
MSFFLELMLRSTLLSKSLLFAILFTNGYRFTPSFSKSNAQ